MKKLVLGGLAGCLLSVSLAAPAIAAPRNWGQEVKECNSSSCYPGGGSRGSYVREQARDGDGPGYAWEIHTLAHPGKSNPSLS